MTLDRMARERLVRAMAEAVIAHADELTGLDQAIGDGDHGLNMKRGFEAVLATLPGLADKPTAEMLKTIGTTLVMKVGGASGPLVGTFFMELGKALPESPARADLVAATDKGLCRVAFDEDALDLAKHFPRAEIVSGGAALADLAARVVAKVESPDRDQDLPIDVQGTAFQEAVWQALRDIPAGETRSYAELAAIAGNPKAVRAAGSACGANHVAVVIPCHRVQRSDGSMGGYAYGVDRKAVLLDREGVQ